jgi:hypothetical protein
VVNIDVQGGSHAAYAGPGAADDLPANAHWNLLNTANGFSASNLTASDGANPTPVGVTLANGYSTYDLGTEGNTLQSDRIYDTLSGGDGIGDFTITGLEAGALYDIFLYTSGLETDFTIDGITKTAIGGDAGAIPTWLEDVHYVLFEGVPGGSPVLGTYAYTDNSFGFAVLAGLQIAKLAPAAGNVIPEPASAMLVLLGLGGLALLRRRA